MQNHRFSKLLFATRCKLPCDITNYVALAIYFVVILGVLS